ARVGEFIRVFAIKSDARAAGLQDQGDELRQFAVAENRGDGEFANIQLIKDLAGGGERFDEDSFLVADIFGDDVEIFQRQSEVLGKRAVMRNDAKHRAARAMRLQ